MRTIILPFIASFVIVLSLTGCDRAKNEEALPPISENEEPSETNANMGSDVVSAENSIEISKDGFSPDVLTVSVGTTVTWINNDTEAHWIVSDPHPTHSVLPELNSKKGLLLSETYQFIFDKKGNFYYHDELNTTMTGKVVVQ